MCSNSFKVSDFSDIDLNLESYLIKFYIRKKKNIKKKFFHHKKTKILKFFLFLQNIINFLSANY